MEEVIFTLYYLYTTTNVPKSDKDLDGNKKVKKSLPLVAGVGIGVAALAALAAGIVIVRKRVHR